MLLPSVQIEFKVISALGIAPAPHLEAPLNRFSLYVLLYDVGLLKRIARLLIDSNLVSSIGAKKIH